MYVAHRHAAWNLYVKTIQDILNKTHQETTGYRLIEIHLNKRPESIWQKYLKPVIPAVNESHEKKRGMVRANSKVRNSPTKFNLGKEVLVLAN